VFGSAFGMGGGSGAIPTRPRAGSDLRYDLEITLEQAFTGYEAELKVPYRASCEPCDGTGATPGTTAATCPTCAGQGRVRAAQGFFQIERTCPRCGGAGRMITDPCRACHGAGQVRRERTLQVKIPGRAWTTARASGWRAKATPASGAGRRATSTSSSRRAARPVRARRAGPALRGARCRSAWPRWAARSRRPACASDDCRTKVKVAEGAQTGRTIRLKNKGMPSLRGRERGDLCVELIVETPTSLTAKQKALLREFCDSLGEAQQPRHAGFFGQGQALLGRRGRR
jgi:molecular chaperone DnaJ